MSIVNFIKTKIKRLLVRTFIFPKIYRMGIQYNVLSVQQTIYSLIHDNKSLGRFGDGEIGLVINKNKPENATDNIFSYQKGSPHLQKRLIDVLNSNNPNFKVGISPVSEGYDKHYKIRCRRGLKGFMCRLGPSWMKYLHKNVQYYNTNITRPFSSFKDYSYSKQIFTELKKIWINKKLLIVEGKGTRLGVGNNLFTKAQSIKRIECPSTNAFESYSNILNSVTHYLNNHSFDLVLLALGPAATVLAYDLCNKGFRAIDVGHIDIEYEWFLHHKICDIPYKCVNEVKGGQKVIPIHNNKYKKEIIEYIK